MISESKAKCDRVIARMLDLNDVLKEEYSEGRVVNIVVQEVEGKFVVMCSLGCDSCPLMTAIESMNDVLNEARDVVKNVGVSVVESQDGVDKLSLRVSCLIGVNVS